MKSALLAGAAGLLLLSGCAGKPSAPDVEAEGVASPEVQLQRTLSRVAKATADLYATRSGERPAVPAELQRPLTWRWSGPLAEGARVLARHLGYAFTAPDEGPALPTVRVDAKDTPALDILKAFGAQAGDCATVAVDPQRRIVEVHRNGG